MGNYECLEKKFIIHSSLIVIARIKSFSFLYTEITVRI